MTDAGLRSLQEPTRNKYFYGKLLDVSHMQLEQCYGIEKRRLLNRLALGPGVVCGLGVTLGTDGKICISPGVAIDGNGREIVVPVPISKDPAEPTDELGCGCGGDPIEGQSTIYLCYTECDAEPVPAYVSECDGVPSKAHSKTVERYRVIVRPGVPDAKPPALTAEQRDAIFPTSPPADFDRRVAAEQTLAITCDAPSDTSCVVLATVTLPTDEAPQTIVDPYSYRAEVFSNTVLFELIAALAERVDACCAAMHPAEDIDVKSGDGQPGEVSTTLANPVELLVTDSSSQPVGGANVALTTTDGELSLDNSAFSTSLTTTSGADGVVEVYWRLGPNAGDQWFTATLDGGGSATARARASAPPQPPPPRIMECEPENGSETDRPTITITFDQEMDHDQLSNPEPWLRGWGFPVNADGFFEEGRRIDWEAGDPGLRTTFFGNFVADGPFLVIVVMRGSPDITAAGGGPDLDADFAGTKLTGAQLNRLWQAGDVFVPNQNFRERATATDAALPSGNGTEGGQFHALFTVRPQ
ncbi:MAG TPA: carboxypeptidase-like regulatory domain-containing protein [Mycobacterium sp.]|jgi:hypothetical protein